MKHHEIIIVGAGAAGIGIGAALQRTGVQPLILDRYGIGSSFSRWPVQTTLLTPSFASNAFGLADLNAITPESSPALLLQTEHPGGSRYCEYLINVAQNENLRIEQPVDVVAVSKEDDLFLLETNEGSFTCRYLVWAAGEFQYPDTEQFPGAPLCRHTATISDFGSLDGSEFVVIGGYESGIDCAIALSIAGKKALVIDRASPWESRDADPSRSLSPRTLDRLRRQQSKGLIQLKGNQLVTTAEQDANGFNVITATNEVFHTAATPLLAGGFAGSTVLIEPLLTRKEDGTILLTDDDMSVSTQRLFLCGPMIRHGGDIYCFIYKFRQRFDRVATAIARLSGIKPNSLAEYSLFANRESVASWFEKSCQC